MCGRPTGDGQPRYACNKLPGNGRCGKVYTLGAPTDTFVKDIVRISLNSQEFVSALRQREQGGDQSAMIDMDSDQRKLEELAEDYASGSSRGQSGCEPGASLKTVWTLPGVVSAHIEASPRSG